MDDSSRTKPRFVESAVVNAQYVEPTARLATVTDVKLCFLKSCIHVQIDCFTHSATFATLELVVKQSVAHECTNSRGWVHRLT